jgi:hypothetical protein
MGMGQPELGLGPVSTMASKAKLWGHGLIQNQPMDMDLVLTSVQLQHVGLGGASSCL